VVSSHGPALPVAGGLGRPFIVIVYNPSRPGETPIVPPDHMRGLRPRQGALPWTTN